MLSYCTHLAIDIEGERGDYTWDQRDFSVRWFNETDIAYILALYDDAGYSDATISEARECYFEQAHVFEGRIREAERQQQAFRQEMWEEQRAAAGPVAGFLMDLGNNPVDTFFECAETTGLCSTEILDALKDRAVEELQAFLEATKLLGTDPRKLVTLIRDVFTELATLVAKGEYEELFKQNFKELYDLLTKWNCSDYKEKCRLIGAAVPELIAAIYAVAQAIGTAVHVGRISSRAIAKRIAKGIKKIKPGFPRKKWRGRKGKGSHRTQFGVKWQEPTADAVERAAKVRKRWKLGPNGDAPPDGIKIDKRTISNEDLVSLSEVHKKEFALVQKKDGWYLYSGETGEVVTDVGPDVKRIIHTHASGGLDPVKYEPQQCDVYKVNPWSASPHDIVRNKEVLDAGSTWEIEVAARDLTDGKVYTHKTPKEDVNVYYNEWVTYGWYDPKTGQFKPGLFDE